jgi:hypothetical protein
MLTVRFRRAGKRREDVARRRADMIRRRLEEDKAIIRRPAQIRLHQ